MPRSYNLGRRAAPKADTRARIVAAALAIYRDRGLAGASNLAIAQAADVAPATVRNHFPGPGRSRARGLRGACSWSCGSRPRRSSTASTTWRARVERLAAELAAFYERSEPWWRAYEREPELISAWSGGVDQYYADIERLMRAALGELSDDERSLAVVASVIGPPTFFALRGAGPLLRRSGSAEPRAHASLARRAPREPAPTGQAEGLADRSTWTGRE